MCAIQNFAAFVLILFHSLAHSCSFPLIHRCLSLFTDYLEYLLQLKRAVCVLSFQLLHIAMASNSDLCYNLLGNSTPQCERNSNTFRALVERNQRPYFQEKTRFTKPNGMSRIHHFTQCNSFVLKFYNINRTCF